MEIWPYLFGRATVDGARKCVPAAERDPLLHEVERAVAVQLVSCGRWWRVLQETASRQLLRQEMLREFHYRDVPVFPALLLDALRLGARHPAIGRRAAAGGRGERGLAPVAHDRLARGARP